MEPLVSVAELEKYIQRSVDPETGALAVAGASGIIRDFCRWPISIERVTFTVDGSGTVVCSLPTLRLVGVDEVRIDGVVVEFADYVALTSVPLTSYTWSENGQLYRPVGWPARARCIQADVVHGYDSTPDTIRAVGLKLAARSVENPVGLVLKTVGQVTRTFDSRTGSEDLSQLQMAQLAGYRLP